MTSGSRSSRRRTSPRRAAPAEPRPDRADPRTYVDPVARQHVRDSEGTAVQLVARHDRVAIRGQGRGDRVDRRHPRRERQRRLGPLELGHHAFEREERRVPVAARVRVARPAEVDRLGESVRCRTGTWRSGRSGRWVCPAPRAATPGRGSHAWRTLDRVPLDRGPAARPAYPGSSARDIGAEVVHEPRAGPSGRPWMRGAPARRARPAAARSGRTARRGHPDRPSEREALAPDRAR